MTSSRVFNALWADKDFHDPEAEIIKAAGIDFNPRYLLKEWQPSEAEVRAKVKDLQTYWRKHGRDVEIIATSKLVET